MTDSKRKQQRKNPSQKKKQKAQQKNRPKPKGKKAAEKKLTEKERLFCLYYCERYNATQSAIRAGYSPKTAREIGYENLTKPHIRKEVDRLKENFDDLVAEMGITKAGIVAEHAKIAWANIAAFHNTWMERKAFEDLPEESKAAIAKIDSKEEPKQIVLNNGTTKTIKMQYVKIELYDKQKALEAIAKIMGWNAADKVDLTSKGEKLKGIPYFLEPPTEKQ